MHKPFKNPALKIDEKGNVIFDKEIYTQVVIWESALVENEEDIANMSKFINENLKTEILFLETIITKPDIVNGFEVLNTGGRPDVLFAINTSKTDMQHFAETRFRVEGTMRWLEDATSKSNGFFDNPIHDKRILEYNTWDAEVQPQVVEQVLKGVKHKAGSNLKDLNC